ncbi:hypothetical protein ABT086_10090 [Streptomyces mirabilis]
MAPSVVAAVGRAATERTAFRDEGAGVEQDRIGAWFRRPTTREGTRAFTEKRAPHGQGR